MEFGCILDKNQQVKHDEVSVGVRNKTDRNNKKLNNHASIMVLLLFILPINNSLFVLPINNSQLNQPSYFLSIAIVVRWKAT